MQLDEGLRGLVKLPQLVHLMQLPPGPAKGATQIALQAVGGGDAAVKSGRPEAVILARRPPAHYPGRLPGQLQWVVHCL